MAASERAEAVAFLSGRARWPGLVGTRIQAAEREVDSMSPAERVFLEIEMMTRRPALHTAEYDPLNWGRG